MVLLNEYSLILLKLQTYVSHVSAMVFLSLLVFLFAKWFTSKKTFPIILYTISLSLVSLNLLMSLLYLDTYLSAAELPIVEPFSIHSYVTNFSGVSNNLGNAMIGESLSMIFDVLSLSSFILMWIATAILLSQYRYKMGRIKYFSLMSIPLLYYIFPFQNYFGDAFFSLIESSPVSFSIIYILSFSATKQVGALLFSLSFWTAAALVYDNRVRQSLLISSIGMAILFGSLEITPLQYSASISFHNEILGQNPSHV